MSNLSFIPFLGGSVTGDFILQPSFISVLEALRLMFTVYLSFLLSLQHFRLVFQWDPIAICCVLHATVFSLTFRRVILVCYLGGKGSMANSVGGVFQTHHPIPPPVREWGPWDVQVLGWGLFWRSYCLVTVEPAVGKAAAAASEEALRQGYRYPPLRGDSEQKM